MPLQPDLCLQPSSNCRFANHLFNRYAYIKLKLIGFNCKNIKFFPGKKIFDGIDIQNLTKDRILVTFKTTDQKVERAIRNAIEVSWTRGNVETFEKIFGYSAASGRNRPTNSEYIARIADNIRLDYKAM